MEARHLAVVGSNRDPALLKGDDSSRDLSDVDDPLAVRQLVVTEYPALCRGVPRWARVGWARPRFERRKLACRCPAAARSRRRRPPTKFVVDL